MKFEIINKSDFNIENKKINDFVMFLVNKLNISDSEFCIVFVSSKEIRDLNKRYRNIDAETDVISFALKEAKGVISNESVLGDIYVCSEVALNQSKEFDSTFLEELYFLISHGLLHLFGYDHIEDADTKEMFDLQEELINEYKKQ